jgi:hypothetical protein
MTPDFTTASPAALRSSVWFERPVNDLQTIVGKSKIPVAHTQALAYVFCMKTNMQIADELTTKAEAIIAGPDAQAKEHTIRVGNYTNTVVTSGDRYIRAARLIEDGLEPLNAAKPDFDAAVEKLEAFVARHGMGSYCRI